MTYVLFEDLYRTLLGCHLSLLMLFYNYMSSVRVRCVCVCVILQSSSQEQTGPPQRIMVVWVECLEKLVSGRVTPMWAYCHRLSILYTQWRWSNVQYMTFAVRHMVKVCRNWCGSLALVSALALVLVVSGAKQLYNSCCAIPAGMGTCILYCAWFLIASHVYLHTFYVCSYGIIHADLSTISVCVYSEIHCWAIHNC